MVDVIGPAETDPAIQSAPDYDGAYWKDQIERAGRYFEKYLKRCENIERIYLEQRAEATSSESRNFPMLWANMSVLQPAVYARQPVPAVDRRWKDKDPVGRAAAELLERCLTFTVDRQDLNSTFKAVRDDFLLVARGTIWARYEATLSQESSQDISESQADEMQEVAEGEYSAPGEPPEIMGESALADYVHWSDFLHEPARRWKDVGWVARRVSLRKEEVIERFGPDALAKLGMNGKTTGRNEAERQQNEGCYRIWEIWCKTSKQCYWIGDGAASLLDSGEPPLDLADFFPCPPPAYGTLPTSTLIPVPDYAYYQGQCIEIDTLTDRIAKLTDQLRLVGFYPGGKGDVTSAIEAAFAPKNENIMVPIPDWNGFTTSGGGASVVWAPISEVVKVFQACVEARQRLIDDVYQITGISDIVRGDSQASETATAQRIKSQWGSVRILDRQAELARFCRDTMRLLGEIIAENFQPKTLLEMSGMKLLTMQEKQAYQMQVQEIQQQGAQQAQQMKAEIQQAMQAIDAMVQLGRMDPQQAEAKKQELNQSTQQALKELEQAVKDGAPQPPEGMDQPTIDEVVELLRTEPARDFRVDIETDSTIQPDEDAEKQRRIEFLQAIGGLIQQAVPVVEKMPTLTPIIGEMILFVARAFRSGRQLETTLEEGIEKTTQVALQPPAPPQPSPDEQIKLKTAEVKGQVEIKKAELGMQQAQMDHQNAVAKHQMDMQRIAMQPAPMPMQPNGGVPQ